MNDFYRGKRAIVTGGCGFVGSHLVELLLERGADVLVLDNMSRGQNIVAETAYADVSDEGVCRDYFKGAHMIFNLAATVAGVHYNATHHYEMFRSNFAVLDTPTRIAAEYGIRHFLQVSSQCVYPNGSTNPCMEPSAFSDLPNPANAGYAMAKRVGELVATWSGLERVIIVRPSNIYGPRDYFDYRAHVIPALIRKCVENDEIHLYGTGKERREFLYVTDAAAGMLYAMEHGEDRRPYNLGTSGATCVPIRMLLSMIKEIAGVREKPVVLHPTAEAGDMVRWSDSSRIEKLGWKYEIGLARGLKETVEWYRENRRSDQ